MTEALRYAFLDEFGGVALFAPKEPFLVVAAGETPSSSGFCCLGSRTKVRVRKRRLLPDFPVEDRS